MYDDAFSKVNKLLSWIILKSYLMCVDICYLNNLSRNVTLCGSVSVCINCLHTDMRLFLFYMFFIFLFLLLVMLIFNLYQFYPQKDCFDSYRVICNVNRTINSKKEIHNCCFVILKPSYSSRQCALRWTQTIHREILVALHCKANKGLYIWPVPGFCQKS